MHSKAGNILTWSTVGRSRERKLMLLVGSKELDKFLATTASPVNYVVQTGRKDVNSKSTHRKMTLNTFADLTGMHDR